MLKKMGTVLLLVMLMMPLLLPQPKAEAAAKKIYVASKSGDLIVRAEGRTSGRVIGKVKAGERMLRTGTRGAWIRVNYKGRAGWIPTRQLRTVRAPAKPTTVSTSAKKIYVASKSGDLIVRAEGSTSGRVIGKVKAGERMLRTGARGAWIRVDYKGRAGWIPTRLLRTVKAPVRKSPVQSSASVKTFTMKATAYTPYCRGCSGITAMGWNVRAKRMNVIAVDPRVIPLGSKVKVYLGNKLMGTYTAADTGGAIKGYKIDILMYSYRSALQFGRKTVTVKVL